MHYKITKAVNVEVYFLMTKISIQTDYLTYNLQGGNQA